MSSKSKVEVPIYEYSKMLPLWELTTALWGGTPAMRKEASKYLPAEPAEPIPAYEIRVKRSVLTNFYKQTVTRLVGKVFKQAVTRNKDIPAQIEELLDNVDNKGCDIDTFSQLWLEYAINDGVCHVLVDSPRAAELPVDPTLGAPTKAAEQAVNLRPYLTLVPAESLIGWKYHEVDGTCVLDQLRIYSCTYEQDPDSEYGQVKVERVRVIEPNLQRVYRKDTSIDDYVLEETIPTTDDVIPLVTLYTNKMGYLIGEPMLLDLAYLNVAHWQSDSDQRNILHVARVPILFGAGLGEDDANQPFTLQIGPNSVTRGPQGSDLKYVEHTGKAVESGEKDLKSLEARMSAIGLDMITRRNTGGAETATGRALDQSEIDSPLQTVAQKLEDSINRVLDFMASWYKLGDDAGGTVEVFKDFGITWRDQKDLDTLLRARAAKDLSRTTLWAELERRGVVSDKFDAKVEMDLLEVESVEELEAAVKSAMAINSLDPEVSPGGSKVIEEILDESEG